MFASTLEIPFEMMVTHLKRDPFMKTLYFVPSACSVYFHYIYCAMKNDITNFIFVLSAHSCVYTNDENLQGDITSTMESQPKNKL